MALFQFLSGLVLLFLGGEMIVRYVVALAYKIRLSPLFISMVLIGFTTSLPELFTCLEAAYRGSDGIVIGNILGSNISNTLLIVGIASLVSPLYYPHTKSLNREGGMLVLSVAIVFVLILYGMAGRIAGLILVILLIGYVFLSMRQESALAEIPASRNQRSRGYLIGLSLLGVAITLIGADLLISGTVTLARRFGISETVIGLSLVAVGTSLPELATALIAVRRQQGAVAFGNILGSNLYNIFGILGLTALIFPFKIPEDFDLIYFWIMAVATCCFLFFAYTKKQVSRLEGFCLLSGYGMYLWILF